MEHTTYFKRLSEKVGDLPWYAGEFIEHNQRHMAVSTRLNYCHDYVIFFDWLISEGFTTEKRTDIPLSILERLSVKDMESFFSFLNHHTGNAKQTVNRKISALKSLFHYLQNIAETPSFEPYIYRNVMAKVAFNLVKEDQETAANRIEGKILHGDEFELFREFIAEGYGQKVKNDKRRHQFFIKNRERDTALVSLLLGSGIRLSELVGLSLSDLDFKKHSIRVIRKGGKEQYVYFSEQAMMDLKEYLLIRTARYNLDKKEKALFVSTAIGPKKSNRRLSHRAVEKIIEKYASAFGKPALSVHKLRHSFATRYHLENNDIPKLKNQLGHESVQTTMIYTHMTNKEMKKAIDKMDAIKGNNED